MNTKMTTLTRLWLTLMLIFGAGLAACGGREEAAAPSRSLDDGYSNVAPVAGHNHAMAAVSVLPPDMRQMPRETTQAYLFSLANPDLAQAVPCYCGCVGLGHVSSYDCYVAEAQPGQAIVFDAHARNCQVCVDITQDAMRLLDEGRSPPEIRAFIDATYAVYGPATPLEMDDHG